MNDISYNLDNIIYLYRKGEFGKVVSILEGRDIDENEDVLVQKIYAFSLIRVNRLSEAQYVLENLLDNYPEDFEVLNALSYIHILKGHKTPALNYLLDAEYYAPIEFKEKIKNNLKLFSDIPDILVLKSYVRPREFLVLSLPEVKFTRKFNFKSLIPNFDFRNLKFNFWVVFWVLVGLFLISGIYFLSNYIFTSLPSKANDKVVYENINRIEIENIEKTTASSIVTNQIILSDKEVVSLFNELRLLLSKDRASNRAKFIANYLLNSNASSQVKSKVEILKTFMEEPVANLDWQPLYEEVSSKPYIYDGVYAVWKGKIVNVSKLPSGVEFTFVVEGDNSNVIKGFIKGRMRNFLDGYVGQTLRALGKIVVSSKEIVFDIQKIIE
ncbi:MAG: tetratricopeptide repeat protein [Brevinematia bacterium]